MALPTRPLTVSVCDSDPLVVQSFGQVAAGAGFEVLTSAEHGPHLLDLIRVFHPSLAIVTNELPGMTGPEIASAVVALDDHPEVIVVTSDERSRHDAFDAGAFAVVERFDVEGLEEAIANAKFLFLTGERRVAGDRRSGDDRRQQQDWSKVTRERRVEDRRKGPRRRDEQDGPDEFVERRQEQDWNQVTVERRQALPQRKP
jgi:DNA-binding NarL/FixJ family response regulator